MQPLRRAVEMQFFGNSDELTKQTNLNHRADVTLIVPGLHVRVRTPAVDRRRIDR